MGSRKRSVGNGRFKAVLYGGLLTTAGVRWPWYKARLKKKKEMVRWAGT